MFFSVRTRGSYITIASRQRDRTKASASRAHARGDDMEASHIWAGRVISTGSHNRRLAANQFRAPRSTRHRGSIHSTGWTKDDESANIQEIF